MTETDLSNYAKSLEPFFKILEMPVTPQETKLARDFEVSTWSEEVRQEQRDAEQRVCPWQGEPAYCIPCKRRDCE